MSMKDLMKQAQEMQSRLQNAQSELTKVKVEGVSGGGLVKIQLNGRHYAQRCEIDPSVYDDEDPETLGDLICAAINMAVDKVEVEARKQMESLASGLNLPNELGGTGDNS